MCLGLFPPPLRDGYFHRIALQIYDNFQFCNAFREKTCNFWKELASFGKKLLLSALRIDEVLLGVDALLGRSFLIYQFAHKPVIDVLLAYSHHVGLLKLPTEGAHIVHGIDHGVELHFAALGVDKLLLGVLLPKRRLLSEVDGDGHLRSHEVGFAKQFGVDLVRLLLCVCNQGGKHNRDDK